MTCSIWSWGSRCGASCGHSATAVPATTWTKRCGRCVSASRTAATITPSVIVETIWPSGTVPFINRAHGWLLAFALLWGLSRYQGQPVDAARNPLGRYQFIAAVLKRLAANHRAANRTLPLTGLDQQTL